MIKGFTETDHVMP